MSKEQRQTVFTPAEDIRTLAHLNEGWGGGHMQGRFALLLERGDSNPQTVISPVEASDDQVVPWQPEDGWITWSQHPNSYSLPIIAQFNGQDPYYFLDEDLGRLLEWQKGGGAVV